MEYASNGKGNLGVTLGAIGTGLGVLNGGLGSLFGGWGNGCSENTPVTRYELDREGKLAAKDRKLFADLFCEPDSLNVETCAERSGFGIVSRMKDCAVGFCGAAAYVVRTLDDAD